MQCSTCTVFIDLCSSSKRSELNCPVVEIWKFRNIPSLFLMTGSLCHEVCWFGFYGISTLVGYLMLNPFLYKLTVLFQIIQFCISIVFVHTLLNIKTVLFQTIQFSVGTVSRSKQFHFKQFRRPYKTVPFQTVQFSISTQF